MPRPPDNAVVERFYRWNAPIYDLTRWIILRGRRSAVEAMGLSSGDRALEVGCGTGLNLGLLRAKVGAAGRVVGVDYSRAMLARARRRCRSNVDLICTDAASLFLRGRFAGALLAYSLTIIPDWRAALACACEHVDPGGTVVILDFGRRPPGFAPLHAAFERFLALHHVYSNRDLHTALSSHVGHVEILRRLDGYVTLLRGTR